MGSYMIAELPGAFRPSLVGERVEVIETGERGNCTAFENGLFWVTFDGIPDLNGYRPGEIRRIHWTRRVVRRLMGKRP